MTIARMIQRIILAIVIRDSHNKNAVCRKKDVRCAYYRPFFHASRTLPAASRISTLRAMETTALTMPEAEATAFARANKVQITFLDIEMGRISGLDVCRELLEINPRMNVIFLTAYREYALDAWETGACGFLVKPLSVEAIRQRLSMLRFPMGGLP